MSNDSNIQIKNTFDLSTRYRINLVLFDVITAHLNDIWNIFVGDSKGKVEFITLSEGTYQKESSLVFDHLKLPIELIRTKRVSQSQKVGFLMVTYSAGCFTLWDTNNNQRAIRNLFLSLEHPSKIV